MKKSIKGGLVGIGLGLLALAMASPAVADEGPSASRMTRETVTVVSIDRTNRAATLQNSDGETKTVDVPPDMKAYDTLKVGDKIDIDYYESVALSVLPVGAKATTSESSSMNRLAPGVGARTHEMTVSATVIAVDPKFNKVTFKGPRGNVRTVTVQDPDVQRKLPGLKVGQVVQITYTQAMAASIRPTSPGSAR
jgi:hypothetical protein